VTVAFDRAQVSDSAGLLRDERIALNPALPVGGRGWAPAQEKMAELLKDTPTAIDGVLELLRGVQEILDSLPPSKAANRVAAFNSLYHTITDRVAQSLRSPAVTDPAFLELLDVEFAKRYFEALRLWGDDDDATPDVWEVLFRRAQHKRMTRLAAAILGVNAHINHDLAIALIATWVELGAPEGDGMHPDYLLINQIFYEEIPGLRRLYSTRWQLKLDTVAGRLDDWSQEILVYTTRAYAWDKAVSLWALRHDSDKFAGALLIMDRSAALLGESLIAGDVMLTRAGAFLVAVRRALRALTFWRPRHRALPRAEVKSSS
jgi:hypothetical protein